MAGAGESHSENGEAPHGTSQIQDIEQDLDTVDEALAALDSGDLAAAEALAAEFGTPGAGSSGGDDRGGDDRGGDDRGGDDHGPEFGAAS